MLGRLTKCIMQLSIILALSAGIYARSHVNSVKGRLVNVDNFADGNELPNNVIDETSVVQRGRVLEEMYDAAISQEDFSTAARMLRHSAEHNTDNDSMLRVLVSRAVKLPDSNDKLSTLSFINILLALNTARSQTLAQREETLRELLSRHSESREMELYNRIEYLCRLCMYLRLTTDGDMLTGYQRELQTLIDNLPPYDLRLKYIFYVHAGETYRAYAMFPESIDVNRKLLDVIDGLKGQCAAAGHAFPFYDVTSFLCCSRLLSCYETLNPDEVDEYYTRAETIASQLPDSILTSVQRRIPHIYHAMAGKRYAEAIPMLRELVVDEAVSDDERLFLLFELIKAADITGDREVLLNALEQSNGIMNERLEHKASSSYKDLHMIYEVNELKATNDLLRLRNQQIENERHKEQLTYALICLGLLSILLVVVYVLYHRSKRLTSSLTRANALIISERDAIRHAQEDLEDASNKAKKARRIKDDFINSMGNEIRTPLEFIVEYSNLIANCSDENQRGYIQRFADIITLNSDLLITQVNDVLNLPLLENVRRSVRIVRTSALEICRDAIEVAGPCLKPGVCLVFASENSADISFDTDPERIWQVLVGLLKNAARFTEEGTITLRFALSPDRKKIIFTVADTGIGVSPEKAGSIFSRSLRHDSKAGGLYVGRILARILGGDLTLDNGHQPGAKFVLTIPVL